MENPDNFSLVEFGFRIIAKRQGIIDYKMANDDRRLTFIAKISDISFQNLTPIIVLLLFTIRYELRGNDLYYVHRCIVL